MPTTAATVLPQTVLTVASPIGATVLPNARPVMPTTAATVLRLFPPVRQMRPVLTSPTAPQKSVHGPAIPVISRREAPASWLPKPAK